jgi:hypothetical protein
MRRAIAARRRIIAALLVATSSWWLSTALSAQVKTRRVYVSALDPRGDPIGDLDADAIQIIEDGIPQPVTRAVRANAPMRIALIVDTSDGAGYELNHLRQALAAFISAIPSEHEILLATTGRQTRVRLQPTTDRKKLMSSATGLFQDGGGSMLIDGLYEIDNRFMKKVDKRSPVFVVLTGDGVESSEAGGMFNDHRWDVWVQSLVARGIPLHTIIFSSGKNGLPGKVMLNAARNTHGQSDVINGSSYLPEKMKNVATEIAASDRQMEGWFEVDYTTKSAAPYPQVAVRLNAPGAIARVQILSTRFVQP